MQISTEYNIYCKGLQSIIQLARIEDFGDLGVGTSGLAKQWRAFLCH